MKETLITLLWNHYKRANDNSYNWFPFTANCTAKSAALDFISKKSNHGPSRPVANPLSNDVKCGKEACTHARN